ncbi:MAG: hypothetical protein AB7N71_01490 [Phycisphaerae bacterium]
MADRARFDGLAAAIEACPEFTLARYWCDADVTVARADAERKGRPDDVLADGGVDVIVLDCETRVAVSQSLAAISKGIHCWRSAPLGRNFSESVAVAKAARGASTCFALESRWEQNRALVRQMIERVDSFVPLCSEIDVSGKGPVLSDWRYGATEAGGGVLLQDAYASLEMLIGLRRLPDSVYAAIGRYRRPTMSPPREIEDFADLSMRYEGDGSAHLRATWDLNPPARSSRHHSGQHSLHADEDRIAVVNATGDTLHASQLPKHDDEAAMLAFAADIVGNQGRDARWRVIERHLAVSAVIDAAYLSARTCHAESPRKLYSLEGWPEPRE